MSSFLQSQLDYVFFVYGLGFILLAAACATLRRDGEPHFARVWLGLFGLLHGIGEWLDLIALDAADSPAFRCARVFVMTLSYVCLVEFGRASTRAITGKGPSRWILVPLLGLVLLGSFAGLSGVNAASRYAVGFVGGIWSGLALWLASRDCDRGQRIPLIAAGVSLCTYAVSAGLIVPTSTFFPASVINQDSFLQLFHFPVQILRGVLAWATAVAVWKFSPAGQAAGRRESSSWRARVMAYLFVTVLMAIIAGGWVLVWETERHEEKRLSDECLRQAQVAAAAIDLSHLQTALSSVPDEQHPDYRRLREQLAAMRRGCPGVRQFYLAQRKNGKILVVVDSEPTRSSLHVPAGSAFADMPPGLDEALASGRATLVRPFEDRSGEWESGTVPLRGRKTGRVIAALGMIKKAGSCSLNEGRERLTSIAITLLVAAMAIVFFTVYQRRLDSEEAIRTSEQGLHHANAQLQQLYDELDQAVTQVKSLMTEVTQDRNLSGRYANPRLARCWEIKGCELDWCPSHGNTKNLRCWEVSGTMCEGRAQGRFAAKFSLCAECEVYRMARQHPVSDLGETFNTMIAMLDERQEELHRTAHHDPLTGLPNRLQFSERLSRLITAGERRRERLAIMFIDLDKFKLINDALGHETGDLLLVETAIRLGSCVRGTDMLARMGGDEFTVILSAGGNADEANAVAERILRTVAAPLEISGHQLTISASIGIALYPDDASDAESLVKNADAAMYAAKESGRNRVQWFTEKISAEVATRVETERDLRLAIERDEFEIYYQPIVEAKTGRLRAAEALIRWNHPQKGMVSPGIFIPVAEETGLMAPIGDYVLRKACAQNRAWQDMGYSPIEVAVNVSSVQLYDPEWLNRLNLILDETGLDAKYLDLELTETTLAQNEDRQIELLSDLSARGVMISIDDFGIGYSSLGRLKRFPIVHIKVDGSFIRDIARSHDDRAMTESIVTMAHNLGIKVTAEWVEGHEQMEIVRTLGCDYVQGYLISPPVPADGFEAFMHEDAELGQPRQRAA